MVTFTRLRMGPRVLPRVASFAMWGLAFGCAAYWALQMGNSSQTPSVVAATGFDVAVDAKSLARLLGQTDAAPAVVTQTSSRYDLLGVVRRGNGEAGAALISVDGRPARTIVVGRAVGEGEVTLTALGARSATLTPKNGAAITLEMPALTSAFTQTGSAPTSAVGQPATPGQPAAPLGETGAPQQTAQFGKPVAVRSPVALLSRPRPGAVTLRTEPAPDEAASTGAQMALRNAAAAVSHAHAPALAARP